MTFPWTVAVDTAPFRRWAESREPELRSRMPKALEDTATRARALAIGGFRSHTGKLAKSIGPRRAGAWRIDVVAKADYAEPLEKGSKEHTIVAHGRALRFFVNGHVMFRRRVTIKARPGLHFMSKAGIAVQPYFRARVREVVAKTFR